MTKARRWRLIKNILRCDLGQIPQRGGHVADCKDLLGTADDSRCRCILLKMPFFAAGTGLFFKAVHENVADLTSRSEMPVHDLTVKNDTTAYTGSERYHNGTFTAFCSTLPVFA